MGKIVRYFNNPDENDSKNTKNKIKKKTWKKKKEIKTSNNKSHSKSNNRGQKNEKNNKHKLKLKTKPKGAGKVPLDPETRAKYDRGAPVDLKGIKFSINKLKYKRKEQAIELAIEEAAAAEILQTEKSGFLQVDEGETTTQFRQTDISNCVDITAAAKNFELHLREHGPYRMRYTRNGRHLLLGGKLGHVAAFDWVTKKLHCDFNVMESVHDICWLHVETMLAVAQKKWVYIYDNQGIELHCLKMLNKVNRMQFLPYHFLLATASDEGYLSWLDVSIGQMVAQYNSNLGRLSMMCQNPYNAIICLGHSKGVVSMWSPNVKEPLAKMLCHSCAMTSLHIDPRGKYLATSGTDRSVKIWDIRKLDGPLQSYRVGSPANEVNFSDKSMLAIGMGNVVEVYKDCCTIAANKAYIRHVMNNKLVNMSFCPYEDILGVATEKGFQSLLVPGSGEPNFDALEANPYQTKKQRQEAEVKALLDKIQPEFITLEPDIVAEVDVPTMVDKIEAKKKLLYLKPPKVNFATNKVKSYLGTAKLVKNKKIVKEQAKREFVKNIKEMNLQEKKEKTVNKKPKSVLDRFLPKDKK